MFSPFGPANIVLLIFGGCCSNVFALEALIQSEPRSGLLITFFQFLFTAFAAYPTQYSPTNGHGILNLRKPDVPLRHWAAMAAMHFSVNMLNNWAFAYHISVPVHIILRSFGSVTTMLAGVLRGKRYSVLQVLSVGLLTVGVVVSAWADAEGKGNSMTFSLSLEALDSDFGKGLAVLLVAQLLSAYMGAYTEDTYSTYKANWKESLFYSHALTIPLFLPLSPILRTQYSRLIRTAPLDTKALKRASPQLKSLVNDDNILVSTLSRTPRGVIFMLINMATQLVCISGVNLLCAVSSAVTVTIVLNIRKLVSFILSTLIFGHELSGLMVFGSTLVFSSGALYGYETSWRLPKIKREREVKEKEKANGHVDGGEKRE